MLLPDYQRPVTTQRIGGDLASQYREPIPNRQPDTSVIWLATRELPADGLLDLDLEMPEINGAMRIMAVVIDGDRYGATEHTIGVVPPIELVAALPRAAAPGDSMRIPVKVRNNTSSSMDLEVAIDVGDAVSLSGNLNATTLHLPPHAEEMLTLELLAGAPGLAPIRIIATPMNPAEGIGRVVFERHIAVRPPFGRARSVFRARVEPQGTAQLDRDRSLEALAGHIDVLIGGNPSIDLKPAFDELIRYPYGCGEQTGSRTEGMLAALGLPIDVIGVDHEALVDMIDSGINRLWRMQRPDGMIPYWEGGTGSEWLTLRTARIAQQAEAAGIVLPEYFLDSMLSQVKRIARNPSSSNRTSAPALACRVLARQHTPDTALMATLASILKTLPMAGRVHLADAFIAVGDGDQANAIIETFSAPATRRATQAGWFGSGVHDAAIAMNVLMEYAPENPSLVEYARFINASRHGSSWRTTFENSAALTALAKWNSMQPQAGVAEGTISIAGHSIAFSKNEPVLHSFSVPQGGSTSEDFLVNTGDGPANVIVITSGIPLTGEVLEPIDSIMRITRTWRGFDGEVIPPGTPLAAGDLITVDLEIQSVTGATYKNVAIVDALPGGMDFELPFLATSAATGETSLHAVDRAEFRDDRLIAFSTVTPRPRRIRYLLRAIVPGSWAVPAPDAMAMYDPDAHARGLGGRVEITLP
jgi:uncharacterized protein YfaS (alpha-2-macroglobulin family)